MANVLMCFKFKRTKEGGRKSVWAHGGATGVTILRVGPNRPTDLTGLCIIHFRVVYLTNCRAVYAWHLHEGYTTLKMGIHMRIPLNRGIHNPENGWFF